MVANRTPAEEKEIIVRDILPQVPRRIDKFFVCVSGDVVGVPSNPTQSTTKKHSTWKESDIWWVNEIRDARVYEVVLKRSPSPARAVIRTTIKLVKAK